MIDSNWRWLHRNNDTTNCQNSQGWDPNVCSDAETCASECTLEGVSAQGYQDTYGVRSDGDELHLDFVAPSGGVGSRIYLLDAE